MTDGKPFSLDHWYPCEVFPFGSSVLFNGSTLAGDNLMISGLRFEWMETTGSYVFKANFPGLNKEELKVNLENCKVLRISVEHSSGTFECRFCLPGDSVAVPYNIKASVETGDLNVTVPKVDANNPVSMPIKIFKIFR